MEDTDPVTAFARQSFGIGYLYPYQRLVVANVLDAFEPEGGTEGRLRQAVILPTGAGKSLCFQLPAGLCPGPTVIVYPLLGLMADQLRRLGETGIGAAVLKGGMSRDERDEAFAAIRSRRAKIVITNPESLAAPGAMEFLSGQSVSHFVVDEAHCVAEWGDGFRPAYLKLGEAIGELDPVVVTAFTATASPPILSRVAEILFQGRPYRLVSGLPDRPNIRYEVRPALSMRRAVREAVSSMEKPLIVFAPSRPGVEILAEDLRDCLPGIDARFYHAGLEKAERSALESWFMGSKDGVLCSTCAYGMGMDKPDVRSVIHFGPPASIEAYLQESGRAGRDGEPSAAVLIHTVGAAPAAASALRPPVAATAEEAALEGGDTKARLLRARADAMSAYAAGGYRCRRAFLLKGLGVQDSDAIACSACDLCEGSETKLAPGWNEIRELARRHPRRFSLGEAAGFLAGDGKSPSAPGKAMLGAWRKDEIEEALSAALSAGALRLRKRHPWKGRLVG